MEGAAVHSLQVAWLTAVGFGTCALTLPLSTPTRWAAAADTDGSQAQLSVHPDHDTFRLPSY